MILKNSDIILISYRCHIDVEMILKRYCLKMSSFCKERFVSRVSELHKLIHYFVASSIEQDFNDLIAEFDGFMRSLNSSFVIQFR